MNFKKLGRAIFIGHYSLQTVKGSRDLEILVDFVVEIPWNTPHVYISEEKKVFLNINSKKNISSDDR